MAKESGKHAHLAKRRTWRKIHLSICQESHKITFK
ncbi:hypothetical protein NEOC65_000014 [Neochlamydia sp. AcF65]|nr:hypothetical protein [Neochlamydia sp. AcF65]